MKNFEIKNWKVYDPDGILKARNAEEAQDTVNPREDVLACENIQNKLLLDLGYYGDETNLEGYWIVHIIGESGWENPLVKAQYKTFNLAYEKTIKLLKEYNA